MKLHELRMKNFRQHADTEIEFPESGIVGFVGANESGKSTVLEAVSFALYGTRATRGTKDSLRWKGAPNRHIAEVTLTFEVGGTVYRIHRTEHDAELRIGGEDEPIAEGISSVDNRVPELLGMTLEEYESTYLCRQGQLQQLDEMGGVEKRQFVLGLMGMGRIDEALADCRSRKNELKSELQGLREGIGEREPLEDELEDAQKKVATRLQAIQDDLRPAVESAEEKLEAAREALAESGEQKERHEELTTTVRQATKDAQEADREKRRAKEKLEGAQEAAERYRELRPELPDLEALREERDELTEARARAKERRTLESVVESRREELERLRSVEHEAEQMVADYSRGDPRGKLSAAEEALEDARESLSELADHDKVAALRSRLESGQECPVCEQTVHQAPDAGEATERLHSARELVEELKARREEAREAVETLDRHEKKLVEVREKIEDKEQELAEAEENLESTDVPAFDADRLEAVEHDIEVGEQLAEKLRGLETKADRVEELEEEYRRWSKRQQKAAKERAEAKGELEAINFDPEAHQALEGDVREAREELSGAREKLARAEEGVESGRERVERAKAQLDAYDERAEKLEAVETEHRIHEQAAERLADFRRAEAASIRPALEELVSGFLAVLTDGRHEAVRLTEDFEVRVQETGGEIEVVSGGAEDVVAIALRLAISQLIAERAGHPLSLLVLDEPFGSLDAVRRQAVLELIRRLGDVFEQVILISHIEEIQDAVDHAYRVEYSEADGRSEVTREASGRVEVAA